MAKTTHGMARTPFYHRFHHMKTRCENRSCPDYCNYGGRGIRVLWPSFEAFRDDMLDSFNEHVRLHGVKNTTLDRIDVNGDYCKENCRWLTPMEQCQNLRRNRFFQWKGGQRLLREILEMEGMDTPTIRSRVKHRIFAGWPIEAAIGLGRKEQWSVWSNTGIKGISQCKRDGGRHYTIRFKNKITTITGLDKAVAKLEEWKRGDG